LSKALLMTVPAISPKAILLVGQSSPLYETRLWILERAGYRVIKCGTAAAAADQLNTGEFDLVVLCGSMPAHETASVAQAAKSLPQPLPVLSFDSVLRSNVDVRLASLENPNLLLKSVGELIMRHHKHPELKSDLVAYADAERHLIHVSDGVCKLLDYRREELIGMRVEEISEAPSSKVAEMFKSYIREGDQSGPYVLKKSNGEKVLIRYQARILDDGCMVSEWEVVRPVNQ
jgi:PAS domain S-box-containing protein